MRAVVGPAWVCMDCIQDDDVEDPEDPKLTQLTVWNGYMVCMYHLPKMIAKFAELKRRQTTRTTLLRG